MEATSARTSSLPCSLRGATVIGLASGRNHAWLKDRGIVQVEYGQIVAERIRQAFGENVDAFINTFGDGYGELAVALGVRPAEQARAEEPLTAAHGMRSSGSRSSRKQV